MMQVYKIRNIRVAEDQPLISIAWLSATARFLF
jgi:hypothetical protein